MRRSRPHLLTTAVFLLGLLFVWVQQARAAGGEHGDPVAPVLIALVFIGFGAAIGGRLMRAAGQPAVLGELLVGMVVANVAYYFREPVITILREGSTMNTVIRTALEQSLSLPEAARRVLPASEHTEVLIQILGGPAGPIAVNIFDFVDLLSRIAVIVLLFLVGLETSVTEMRKVGFSATVVALVGVVCPFLLGLASMWLVMPEAPVEKDIFIGAILTATSVGITARVFRDLRQTQREEAKIILGAAVIDDILGLIILAVVSALVVSGSVSVGVLASITAKAVLFLVGSIGIGVWVTPKLVKRMAKLDIENVKLLFGLGLAFLFSWLANLMGLATIIGAFAAGLVLEEFFLDELKGHSLRDALSSLETLIVPVFFVVMGMQVKLDTFADTSVILMATVLTVMAIIGKVVSGFVVSSRLDRLSIGIGMMPRGEVGLIFASIGKGLGVVNDAVFSAVVIMVMVTTLLTPMLLKITLARGQKPA